MRNIACFLRCVLVAALLSSCDKHLHDFELDEKSFGSDTIKEIENNSGVILPSDARGINYFYKAPIDPGFAVKIEISVESKAEMLRRISQIEDKDIHVSGALGPRFRWWVPKQVKVLMNRGTETSSTYLRAILTDENGKTFLYLDWAVM